VEIMTRRISTEQHRLLPGRVIVAYSESHILPKRRD
jgi:hypothetical protein